MMGSTKKRILFFGLFFIVASPGYSQYYNSKPGASNSNVQEGTAVYYADYLHGRGTAMGEVYRRDEYTAAHKTFPKGTLLRVTRLDNNQSVVVRVNDRGPYDPNVIVDLSRIAARDIGLVKKGRARVRVERVGFSNTNPKNGQYAEQGNTPPIRSGHAYSDISGSNTPSGYSYSGSQLQSRGYSYSGNASTPYNSSAATLSNSASGYAVQLASYGEIDNATRQVQQLQQNGLSNVSIWKKNGYHKVVIAPFASKASASRYLQNLRQQYLEDGIVVKIR